MLAGAASWELDSKNTVELARSQMLDILLPTKLMGRNHRKLWKGNSSANTFRLTISKSRKYQGMIVMSLEAIFKFIAENPPTALVVGGILFFLVGAFFAPVSPITANILLSVAPWLIGLGVVLQILWLFLKSGRLG